MKQHFKLTTSDDLNDLKITDVIDLDFLQRFQDDFAKGVGLASVTVDVNGTPVTDPSSYTIRFLIPLPHPACR